MAGNKIFYPFALAIFKPNFFKVVNGGEELLQIIFHAYMLMHFLTRKQTR